VAVRGRPPIEKTVAGTIRHLLEQVTPPGSRLAAGPGPVPRAVSRFDRILQRRAAVYQFAGPPDCVLRAARGRSRRDLLLSDGTAVRRGDPILELHLWNEHLPRIPRGGPTLAWAMLVRRRFDRSFQALAWHVAHDAAEVRAVSARCAFVTSCGRDQLARLAADYALDLFDDAPEPGRLQRFQDFLENVYNLGLILSFNPAARLGDALRRERFQLWISRGRLYAAHGGF
jgi:hypothetical protein